MTGRQHAIFKIPHFGSFVFCVEAEKHGDDPVKHTNVYGGVAFCSACGATDHPEA